jgi:hypothetical protein
VVWSFFELSEQDESAIAIISTSAKELILDICIPLFDFEIMRANIDFNFSILP